LSPLAVKGSLILVNPPRFAQLSRHTPSNPCDSHHIVDQSRYGWPLRIHNGLHSMALCTNGRRHVRKLRGWREIRKFTRKAEVII
jgi:hypothetical protein